ncbi:MAG: helix-turn-helix transcriptional regulator, partial [Clostridia bacterium]|nr:helix-turn-helix transcriptional regulator [Clostridia bacterium]
TQMFNFVVDNIEFVVKRSYPPNSSYSISKKNTYRLVYILEGSAAFCFENEKMISKKGDILLLAPANDHEVKVIGDENYAFISMSFSAEISHFFSVYQANKPEAEEIFKNAYRLFTMNDEYKQFYVKGYIYPLVCDIIKENNPIVFSKPEIERVIVFINQNYCNKITLDELSEISGYSLTHFKRLFLEHTKTSPKKYINHLRINKAKNLLKSNLFTISEVAVRCGFENIYYFSNAFKKETGLSPKEYMKK